MEHGDRLAAQPLVARPAEQEVGVVDHARDAAATRIHGLGGGPPVLAHERLGLVVDAVEFAVTRSG